MLNTLSQQLIRLMIEIEGKQFKNKRSVSNHFRWRIKTGLNSSFPECYEQFFYPAPVCEYCNERKCSLISVEEGWSNRCGDLNCDIVHKAKIKEKCINSIVSYNGDPLFLNHFRDNIDVYLNLCNPNSNEIVQFPYDGSFHKKKYVKSQISRLTPSEFVSSIWPIIKSICASCECTYEENLYDYTYNRLTCCGSHRCRSWIRHHSVSQREVMETEMAKKIQKLKDRSRMLNFRGAPVFVVNEVKDFLVLSKDVFESSGLSIDDFFKECVGYGCKACGKSLSAKKYVGNIFETKDSKFCSYDCYHAAVRNGMYPASDEYRAKLSKAIKESIASGRHTPCVTNSWAKSRLVVDSIPFRSSWEAAFWMFNPTLLYEKMRIRYFDPIKKTDRTYIVDFLDEKNKILYEIKPDCNKTDDIVIAKEKAAIDFCEKNGYTYIMVGNSWFKKNINEIIEKSKLYTIDEVFYKRMKQFYDNPSKN